MSNLPAEKVTHAHAENWSSDDRTLCGVAIEDLLAKGKVIELLAAPGSLVTCGQCKQIIAHCQDSFTASYRFRRDRK